MKYSELITITTVLLLIAALILVIDYKKPVGTELIPAYEISEIYPFQSSIYLKDGMKIDGTGVKYWFGESRSDTMTVHVHKNILGTLKYTLAE